MNSNVKKLNKPPITQVILGIQFDKLFKSDDLIDDFIEKAKLKEKYPKKQELGAVTFEISENPKIIKNNMKSVILSSENELENIQIENNKILFSDKSAYDEFSVFYQKFSDILLPIIEYLGENPKINSIGLRYINKFVLPVDNISNYFKILPTIDTNNFAGIKNYVSISNLIAISNQLIEANTKTFFSPVEENKLQIIFDIDTNYKDTFDLTTDLSCIKMRLDELKLFENNIFFQNFVDINKMEDFN